MLGLIGNASSQILPGKLACFFNGRKVTTWFNIICHIDDLCQLGHIGCPRCMEANGVQNIFIMHAQFVFNHLSTDKTMPDRVAIV